MAMAFISTSAISARATLIRSLRRCQRNHARTIDVVLATKVYSRMGSGRNDVGASRAISWTRPRRQSCTSSGLVRSATTKRWQKGRDLAGPGIWQVRPGRNLAVGRITERARQGAICAKRRRPRRPAHPTSLNEKRLPERSRASENQRTATQPARPAITVVKYDDPAVLAKS
jgi:hypothetical protein